MHGYSFVRPPESMTGVGTTGAEETNVINITQNPGIKGVYKGRSQHDNNDLRDSVLTPKAFPAKNEKQLKTPKGQEGENSIMDDQTTLTALKNKFMAAPDDPGNVREVINALAPEQQKAALSAYFKEQARAKPEPELRPLPSPGGEYKKIQPFARMSKDEIKAFVGDVWGHWLAAFNKDLEIDAMSRDDLRQRDRRLMNRLEKIFTPEELLEIIQTKSRRIGVVDEMPTEVEAKKAQQIASYARLHGVYSALG